MHNFFRYFGLAVLLLLGLSLAGLAWGVLSLRSIVSEQFSSMSLEAYTCADFRTDVERTDGPALRPLVAAVMAYGLGEQSIEQLESTFQQTGVIPAVSKVYQLCEGKPETPLLRLLVNQTVAAPPLDGAPPSSPTGEGEPASKTPPQSSFEVPAPESPPADASRIIPQNRPEDL